MFISLALRGPIRWKSTKFSIFFFAKSIHLFILFHLVWQPLPWGNEKYVWQGYKGCVLSQKGGSVSFWLVCLLFYFIYFIFFSPFTTLQYLIFSTINCPKTSQVAPDDTPTFEWRASVCGRQCLLFQVFSWTFYFFVFFLSLKLFTGRNFEARTLRFVLFGSLRVSKHAYWSMKWLYLQMARSQSVVKMPLHPFYLHLILYNLYIRLFYTHRLHTLLTLCFIHYYYFVCILRLHPCAKRLCSFQSHIYCIL